DSALDPGSATNPHTVFSDRFQLRGDLVVPAGETFEVGPLASIFVDANLTPEGPSNLGHLSGLCEIRVEGNMLVQSCEYFGVESSITIDSGGLCTVANLGLITIDDGQVLHVYAGGQLNLETGGTITVKSGGQLIIDGVFNNAGTLTLESGAAMTLTEDSEVFLATDLSIPALVTFTAGTGAVITAALTDARGTGSDPNRVEINCGGVMNLTGLSSLPVVLKAQTAGAGNWVGVSFSAPNDNRSSTWSNVLISDAITGISITGGSNPMAFSSFEVASCTTGVMVSNRNDITLSDGEVRACSDGVYCAGADIAIDALSIHGNTVGIRCSNDSDPTLRWCNIYGNSNGIITMDRYSTPDLGTISDPGDNIFPKRSGNTYNVVAFDPVSDIHAQNNWWGTTNVSEIQAKIVVIDQPPAGCGSVIFQPFLTDEPLPPEASLRPGLDKSPKVPASTYLDQNYPNPFNPMTTIRIGLSEPSYVALRIYDVSGRLVRTLVAEHLAAGCYDKVWDGRDSRGESVASGIYFYKLDTKSVTETKKMILLR
ncbi:MAG: FlgD immunoglobulin-like domain containing protein, partial [Candidatus Krumholzibacteria bacterium]|nr:FlgD immunoglobulin-like domain containing protein [Candidatus Krumholzibacteria bacterium]